MPLPFSTLQRGASGERVRELHERLAALGQAAIADVIDSFGDETVALVEAFQRAKGLLITGEVDEVTWSRLVEAGWRLGDRLLYFSRPHLRGDDIAELQVRLAQLGFNPGRIDGIFGPILEDAVRDFQRNCDLPVDGTLTRRTLVELLRVAPSAALRNLVTDARDQAGFDANEAGPLVLCGDSPLRTLIEENVAGRLNVVSLATSATDEIASFANDNNACVVLSMASTEPLDGVHLHYWASYRSHSRRGEQFASSIASSLAKTELVGRVELTGMALPILRETRMTTLHIEHGVLDDSGLAGLAAVISTVLLEVFHR